MEGSLLAWWTWTVYGLVIVAVESWLRDVIWVSVKLAGGGVANVWVAVCKVGFQVGRSTGVLLLYC